MTTGQYLSMDQLAAYASRAGFKGEALRNIVAIAWAEGGGQVDAVGDGGNSVSTLQIYMPAHPQYDRNELLSDPAYAFKAAYEISGGGKNFDAWTTWSHRTDAGAKANAQQYLPAVDKAVQAVGAAGGNIDLTPSLNRPKGGGVTSPDVSSSASMTATNDTQGGSLTAQSATIDDSITPQSTPAQVEAYIRKHYPDVVPFLTNPDVRKVALDGAMNNKADSEVLHDLQSTPYYQSHQHASRNFDALIGSDPSTAGALVDSTKQKLSALLATHGVTGIDDATLGTAAKQAIRNGWVDLSGAVTDTASLNSFAVFTLGSQHPDLSKPLPAGKEAVTADQLAAIAKSYFVPMTQKDLNNAALEIQAGRSTVDAFQSQIAQHSKSLFQNDAGVQSAIDSGKAPSEFFAPIRNVIAQTLELSPDSVDLMSPQYQAVLQTYDPKAKVNRAMTLGEASQWARNQDGFKQTTAYKQTDGDYATKILQLLGKASF